MPDLICPPWDSCRPVRVGVGLLTMNVYSAAFAPVFFGKPLSAVVGHVLRGDIPLGEQPWIWAGCAAFGALMLSGGLLRVRTEGHGLTPGSFLWSAGEIAAVSWLLANYIGPGLTYTAFGDHVVRMLLIAWAASNASNIVLQLVEVWRRRPVPEGVPLMPHSMRGRDWLQVLRRRRVEVIEETDIEADYLAQLLNHRANAPYAVPPRIGHGAAPQIVHVPDENGNLIPLLPHDERVPVNRRSR
jgi:hypothetical protein